MRARNDGMTLSRRVLPTLRITSVLMPGLVRALSTSFCAAAKLLPLPVPP